MASTSFTPNLHLCAWSANDKPKRTDFVNDNSKIDTALGSHINNSNIHLTSQEKANLSTPYIVKGYVGTGTATRSIPLDGSFKLAIVYQKDSPSSHTDSSSNSVLHLAIVSKILGSSANVTLSDTALTVTQDTTATDGMKNNFNEENAQYVIVLFR